MQWSNFKTLVAENLDLAQAINWHIGPSKQLDSQELRKWIEQKVLYVAVRPWDSLRLDARSGEVDGYSIEYSVWFRIENQDAQGWRLRSTSVDEEGPAVSGLIESLELWHSEFWAKQPGNHSLIIEAITCHKKGWTRTRILSDESLEIYRPPEGFTP